MERLGICPLLFVVFLVLKLCKAIAWSWWLVTCPIWILPALAIALLFVALLFGEVKYNDLKYQIKKGLKNA